MSATLDLEKARVATDRPAFLAHYLHPVVFGGVVAGRDHHTAVVAVEGGCEINHFRSDQAKVNDVDTRVVQALRKRLIKLGAAQADVVADADLLCPGFIGEGSADRVSDVGVQLRGDDAAYVVGFKAGEVLAHSSYVIPE